MFHFALHFFVFVLILAAGWVLFLAWLLGLMIRAIWMTFSRVTGWVRPPRSARPMTRKCAGFRCGAANPASANFCRRCGTALIRSAAKRSTSHSAASRQWASSPVSL